MMPARRRPLLRSPTVRLMTAAAPPAARMNVSLGSQAPSENCHTGLDVSRMLPCERCNCHQIVYSSETWSAGGVFRSKLRPVGNNSSLRVAYRKYRDMLETTENDQNPTPKR